MRLSEAAIPPNVLDEQPRQVSASLADMRAKLRDRLRAERSSVLPDYEERRLFDLEEARRRAFVKMTVDKDIKKDRISAALRWLAIKHVVLIHNRNSIDRCRISARTLANHSEFVVEWVNVRDVSDMGSIVMSDLEDIEVDQGPPFVIYLHLAAARPQAVRRSRGRPSLKLEPETPDEGLRLFTHLSTLLEASRTHALVEERLAMLGETF